MRIIEKLSDKIEKEINYTKEYIKCALEVKENYPQVADAFIVLLMKN